MGSTKRKLEELNVMDDFLMNRLASDSEVGEDFCRVLLSTLLRRRVGRVTVTAQKVIPPLSPDTRGIRLDVKAEETVYRPGKEGDVAVNLYDIEPHLRRSGDLPRHNRFYQAMTDSSRLPSGEKGYERLPDLYVLMILDRDPFGYGQMVYSIGNRCEEVEELAYEDGLHFYYFNTRGELGGNEEIRRMLRYLQDSREENATDEATKCLHGYTQRVKIQPEVRRSYMLWEEYVEELKEEGREEGREEGTREGIRRGMEEGISQGISQGIRQSILDVLEGYGDIPERVLKRLYAEPDPDTLRGWLRLAARAESVENFEEEIG